MSQIPQKHLEKNFFSSHFDHQNSFFFDFEKFSDFARLSGLGRKKVILRPLRARKKFSRHSTPMMWVFNI